MKRILLLTFIGIFSFHIGQANNPIDSVDFPKSWEGIWKGELEIFNGMGKVQSLPMELHIFPNDTSVVRWSWTIIYGEDKEAGKRDYELIEKDKSKGIYLVDEKNTIVLDGFLLGGKFFERFEVMGNLLMTSTEKVNENELVWEIISGKLTPISTTGDQDFEGEEIPPVNGYGINILQRARLKKV
ncbi:MAG: hypothetical protein NXI23_00445 [Bacteroidetes bacterium]|jgi:hypothetical protein|nr:hypothetical protein [Bacteroidota bacterium]